MTDCSPPFDGAAAAARKRCGWSVIVIAPFFPPTALGCLLVMGKLDDH